MKRLLIAVAALWIFAAPASSQSTDTTGSSTTGSSAQTAPNQQVVQPGPGENPAGAGGNAEATRPASDAASGRTPADNAVPQQQSGGAGGFLWAGVGVFLLIVGAIAIFYAMRPRRAAPVRSETSDAAVRASFKEDEVPPGR